MAFTNAFNKSMINSSAGKWARIIIGTLFSALLLYLAMRGVAFSDAWHTISELRWSYLHYAFGLTLVSPLVRAWRWKQLYDGESPGFWLLVRAVAVGQTLNFVVPFRSGEVARVLMVGGRKLDTAGTIAFEKLLDAAFFAALCLVLPFVWAVPKWLEGPRESVIIMAAVYIAVVAAFVLVIPRVSGFPRLVRVPRLRSIPLTITATLFLGISGVMVNNLVLRSLHIQAPFMAAVVLLVILQAGVAIPSTPGKLGVFQYLSVLGLSLFSVGNAPALAFGLVMHLLVFLPTAVMAALFLVFSRQKSGAGI
jgi:uncharacterized membrane protein YbhN (UPF0104 family)